MNDKEYKRSGRNILPINKVVTAVKTEEAVEAVKTAATAAGFDRDSIMTHHGETGKKYIDVDGSEHGFLTQLVRAYQRLSGPEKRMIDMAESALEAGAYLIGIQTNGSEEQQISARDAVEPYSDYPIFFCGRFTITQLGYGKSDNI